MGRSRGGLTTKIHALVDANGNPIYSLGYAEKILKGWGTRPSDWQVGVTLQSLLSAEK